MSLLINTIGQKWGTNTPIEIQNMQKTLSAASENLTVYANNNEQDVTESVKKLQNIIDIMGRKLHFNVHNDLGKVIVKVIDSDTDKVIKEIPSIEIQKVQLHIKEVLGLLIDEKI